MKTQKLFLTCTIIGLLTALPAIAQVTLPDTVEASIRGGASAAIDQDEATLGYVMVKNDPTPFTSARKAYFKFDFTGQTPNTNALLKLKFTTAANNARQHIQVWTLNQDFAAFTSSVLTWNGAQANDTAGNGLLTVGAFTATARTEFTSPNSAGANSTVTIPPPWGDAIISSSLCLALGTVTDAINGANGTRIGLNTTALEFTAITSGSPPSIGAIPNLTVSATINSVTNAFAVNDPEDGPNSLAPVAVSSNEAVVPSANVFFDGSGASRTVYVVGVAAGTANITVSVIDSAGNPADRIFTVTVIPLNFAPAVSTPSPTNTPLDTSVTVPFIIGDIETPASSLVVTGEVASYSTAILSSLTFGTDGSGTNRTVTVTPATGANGVGVVKISVSDTNGNTNTISFGVMVLAGPKVVFNDHFDYPTATVGLFPGSANLWARRSVNAGTVNFSTQAGTAYIRPKASADDGAAALAGGPYTPGSRSVLYTKCIATWVDVGAELAYNSVGAGFLDLSQNGTATSILVADVATYTNAAPPGNFNLGLYDGAGAVQPNTNVDIPTLGGPYTIVTRYDVGQGKSALWVNATSEADPYVSATDATSPVSINYVGLRQELGMGYIFLDDLSVTVVIKPLITFITPPVGGALDIFFSASANDVVGDFGVEGASVVTGPYGNVSATITSLGGGNYKASVTGVTGSRNFYRVKRLSVTF